MPAPLGNQNAAKAKRWEAAICRALSSYPLPPDSTDCSDLIKGLNQAAHKFVANMMDAEEVSFFRELGDRLDGKPAQTIEADVLTRHAFAVPVDGKDTEDAAAWVTTTAP